MKMLSNFSGTGVGGIGRGVDWEALDAPGTYGCFLVAALMGDSLREPAKPNIAGCRKVKRNVKTWGPRGLLTGLTCLVPTEAGTADMKLQALRYIGARQLLEVNYCHCSSQRPGE